MANLPSNRTKLQAAITNQIAGTTADASANINAVIEAYDTIDTLNQKVDGLVSSSILTNVPPDTLSRQAIINGNFDRWQRASSFVNPSTNAFTADRWFASYLADGGSLPATITHLPVTIPPGTIPGGIIGYRLVWDGAGSGFGTNAGYGIYQRIENGTRYLCGAGRKVTISFYAQSNVAGKKIGISLSQRYGTGGSPSANESLMGVVITLGVVFTKYTFTFITNTLQGKTFGSNNDDYLQLGIGVMWGSTDGSNRYASTTAEGFQSAGEVVISQVQFNAGDVAYPFQPKSVDAEAKDALRYAMIPQSNSVFARATSVTANAITFDVSLPVQLRATPTIRGAANTDIVVNALSGTPQSGFAFSTTLTATGTRITATKTAHGLSDAYLEIKTTSGLEAEL